MTALAVQRTTSRRGLWLFAGLVVLLFLAAASLMLGVQSVTFTDVLHALGGSTDTLAESAVSRRFPRTVLAVLVGAALALSGLAFQAITRNPLADPGLMGISSGAVLAVVICMTFIGISHPLTLMIIAMLGAAVTAIWVYTIGSLGGGGMTPTKLALSGAATAAAVGSLSVAIMLPRIDLLRSFQFWRVGSVGGAGWDRIALVFPLLCLGALICVIGARGMNTLALGDDLATGLGERVQRTRIFVALGGVILCGAATAVAGPIAFVGLVIPHVCRLVWGADHRWLVPFCAVMGAALLLAADVVGRLVAQPEEVEVGVVTAFIGAPVLIWIVRVRQLKGL